MCSSSCSCSIELILLKTVDTMPNSNKRRLYIAFFHREATKEVPVKFHTAFLVTPKNLKTTSNKKNSHLYHVVNRISPETGEDTWIFESRETRSRTQYLAGVMFLGKLPGSISDANLHDILDKVPRQDLVRDKRAWRCCNWIWDALPVGIVILSVVSKG